MFVQESHKIILMLVVTDYIWSDFSGHIENLRRHFSPRSMDSWEALLIRDGASARVPEKLLNDTVSPQTLKLPSIPSSLQCKPVSTFFFHSARLIVL